MSEWIVDIQSMIPMGQFGERLVVARREAMPERYAILCAAKLKEVSINEEIGDDGVFMTGHTFSSGMFGKGEIDQFLQAMMDAGWRRGLRPKNFDPSAGELAAVNRHLEDMRKVAMQRAPNVSNPDLVNEEFKDTGDADKRW